MLTPKVTQAPKAKSQAETQTKALLPTVVLGWAPPQGPVEGGLSCCPRPAQDWAWMGCGEAALVFRP